MTTENTENEHGTVHGYQAPAGRIAVEAIIAGGEHDVYDIIEEERAAVRVEDPETGHVFVLGPDAARRKADLVENHSPDGRAGRGLAAEIRSAADKADRLLEPETDGGEPPEDAEPAGETDDGEPVWVDTTTSGVTVTLPRTTLRERVARGRASDNEERWGEQDIVTLVLALAEEVGEMAEAVVPEVCPDPVERPAAAEAHWMMSRVAGTGRSVRRFLEETHEDAGGNPLPPERRPDPVEPRTGASADDFREEVYDALALLYQIDRRVYTGALGGDEE